MFKPAFLIIISTVHMCFGSNKITIDVTRSEKKTSKAPYEKFGFKENSTGYNLPEDLKGPIPVDLLPYSAISYSGTIYIGET